MDHEKVKGTWLVKQAHDDYRALQSMCMDTYFSIATKDS